MEYHSRTSGLLTLLVAFTAGYILAGIVPELMDYASNLVTQFQQGIDDAIPTR